MLRGRLSAACAGRSSLSDESKLVLLVWLAALVLQPLLLLLFALMSPSLLLLPLRRCGCRAVALVAAVAGAKMLPPPLPLLLLVLRVALARVAAACKQAWVFLVRANLHTRYALLPSAPFVALLLPWPPPSVRGSVVELCTPCQ